VTGRAATITGIYLVTDTRLCGGPLGVVETVRQAVRGGIAAVQVRDPRATTRQLVALCTAVRDALAGSRIPLVVNDRVDVALAVRADGVHLGQDDLPPQVARELLGPGAHIGFSVSNERELADALTLPAGTVDLLGVGPVRDTPSKTDAAPAMGFDGLAAVCQLSAVPCVAIGGVKQADLPAVRAAGAAGAAVVSAVCGHPDPRRATQELVLGWAAAVERSEGGSRR
jgi:thiamine-phosphate diphosphorylase